MKAFIAPTFLGPTVTAMFMIALGLMTTQSNADDWPTFRGADRTAIAPDGDLLQEWPEGGPKLVWETAGAGRGYAGVAIADGKLFTLGDAPSTADDKDEYVTCFDLTTGAPVWKTKTGPAWKKGSPTWQSSRSTPTVDGDRVYILTPEGKLFCFDTDNGDERWQVDLKAQYGGKKAEVWGYSESVLIDGDRLICTPGGPKNTMIALDKISGEKIWSNRWPGNIGAGHSSIVISEVDRRKIYVQITGSGAMGVDADNGEILWDWEVDKTTAIIPTPVVRDDLVFLAIGYKRGGILLRQVPDGDKVNVEEVYELNKKLSNKHGGVVLVGDHVYGDSDDKGMPFCAELMTGKVKWKSRGAGKKSASIAAADGHLYIRYSDGTMTLVEANPESFNEVSSFKVPGSGDRPSWAHPVISNGKLYLREGDKILCYDITAS